MEIIPVEEESYFCIKKHLRYIILTSKLYQSYGCSFDTAWAKFYQKFIVVPLTSLWYYFDIILMPFWHYFCVSF